MYRWYQDSACCFVYLADVTITEWSNNIAESEWFTRGWTLQELLAPHEAIFFNAEWVQLGTKGTHRVMLSVITSIPAEVLENLTNVEQYNTAQRLSWAAMRKTTRPEDMAYSLLGLLGVLIPLQYGEGGSSAFERLQREVMERYSDESLFAWSNSWRVPKVDILVDHTACLHDPADSSEAMKMALTGFLADTTSCFAQCYAVSTVHEWDPPHPIRVTSNGVETRRELLNLRIADATKDIFSAGDDPVKVCRLACARKINYHGTAQQQPCYMLLIAEPSMIDSPTGRWRRLMFCYDKDANMFASCMQSIHDGFEAAEARMYICIHWPKEDEGCLDRPRPVRTRAKELITLSWVVPSSCSVREES